VLLVEGIRVPKPFTGEAYGRRIRYLWEVADFRKYLTIAKWIP